MNPQRHARSSTSGACTAAPWPAATAAELSRLRDAAKARATELRREAIIEVWRGAGRCLAAVVEPTRRAALGLATWLQQHAWTRAPGAPGERP